MQLSVIIPYHNNKVELLRLLESIPEDSSLEILIIDDHSEVALEEVPHSRAKILQQRDGARWAGAARNLGMFHAQGDYLLFADSDDYFVKGAFNILSESLFGEDVIFFKPLSIKENGNASNRHVLYEGLVDMYISNGANDILYKFHVPWSKAFRREFLIDKSIFFDEVIASNDVLFSLKASILCGNFRVLNKSIYCVVESASSLTKMRSEEVIDSRFDALSRYNDFLIARGDKKLAAMSGHLKNSIYFGFSKFMYRLFYCINKGYPIFYNFSHFIRALRYLSSKK